MLFLDLPIWNTKKGHAKDIVVGGIYSNYTICLNPTSIIM